MTVPGGTVANLGAPRPDLALQGVGVGVSPLETPERGMMCTRVLGAPGLSGANTMLDQGSPGHRGKLIHQIAPDGRAWCAVIVLIAPSLTLTC